MLAAKQVIYERLARGAVEAFGKRNLKAYFVNEREEARNNDLPPGAERRRRMVAEGST